MSTATKRSVYVDDLYRGVGSHTSCMRILFTAFALIRGAAGRISRARPRACISVPRSATYVTNVRYSLGESRVRYVKSAVTLRAYVWRVTSPWNARASIGAHATRDYSPRRRKKRAHMEAPPEHRSARIAPDRDVAQATAYRTIRSDLMKCRGQISSF